MDLFDPISLATFVGAVLLVSLTPGPDMLYVLDRALGVGSRGGTAAALGITVGRTLHLLAAVFAYATLIRSVPAASTALRYAGGTYLIYLGLHNLNKVAAARPTARGQPRLARIFLRGILVNMLNPKALTFYVAFIPQFVDSTRGMEGLQFLVLGTIQNATGTSIQLVVARQGGRSRDRAWRRSRLHTGSRYACALVLACLGLRLLVWGD